VFGVYPEENNIRICLLLMLKPLWHPNDGVVLTHYEIPRRFSSGRAEREAIRYFRSRHENFG